ncbi:MFS transporter [Phreatobacter sp. AB_2022a]|uniref:MFS transporter n=1 Tax=Phreatobacter sp. AB_2022a TaxID=3003134 RepID=UPI002286F904|nr:MFS transporter [Phreatobacter sp. AB_2022a]MCZ0732977.1 MFS transporter [Phreatobacter sp. AB_2022a]
MAAPSGGALDITAVVDRSPIGSFQRLTLALCGLVLIIDGFDVQAIGYVAPAIVAEWQVGKGALSVLFTVSVAGAILGSLLLGILADRWGRRPVLIGSTLFFGLGMLSTAWARSFEELQWIRLITNIGLGGVMANAMALAGEYSPARWRVTLMMLISCGYTFGAAIGGLVAAVLIPSFGWRSVFVFGGIAPLVIAAAMLVWLPESMQLIIARGWSTQRIAGWLKRIDPAVEAGPATRYHRPDVTKGRLADLFRDGRAPMTLILFAICFMNLLDLTFLSNWVPTVLRGMDFSQTHAVLAGTTLQIGGTIGTVVMGILIDRLGFARVLVPCFLAAAIGIVLLGNPMGSIAIVFAAAFVAGFGIIGGQPAVNAFAGTRYPTTLRATVIGWGLGIGRLGALSGLMGSGALMAQQWPIGLIFVLVAIPALISAILTAVIVGIKWTPESTAPDLAATVPARN